MLARKVPQPPGGANPNEGRAQDDALLRPDPERMVLGRVGVQPGALEGQRVGELRAVGPQGVEERELPEVEELQRAARAPDEEAVLRHEAEADHGVAGLPDLVLRGVPPLARKPLSKRRRHFRGCKSAQAHLLLQGEAGDGAAGAPAPERGRVRGGEALLRALPAARVHDVRDEVRGLREARFSLAVRVLFLFSSHSTCTF